MCRRMMYRRDPVPLKEATMDVLDDVADLITQLYEGQIEPASFHSQGPALVERINKVLARWSGT